MDLHNQLGCVWMQICQSNWTMVNQDVPDTEMGFLHDDYNNLHEYTL